MKRRVVLISVAVLVLVALSPIPSGAWNNYSPVNPLNSRLYGLDILEDDWFYNYDFLNENAVDGNVDWPMNVLFSNNATKARIWEIYWGLSDHSPMYGKLADSLCEGDPLWQWDSDLGTRTSPECPGAPDATHMRIYAANHAFMYNSTLGFYVVCSTHWDRMWNICGWSESSEGDIGYYARDRGYRVNWNIHYFRNYEPYRAEWGMGVHVWDNNGYATEIDIP